EFNTIMLGILSNNEQVGLYAAASQIINKVPHISFAIAAGTMPIFSTINSAKVDKLKSTFYKLLKINSYIMLALSGIILLGSQLILPFVIGDQYTDSVVVLKLLVPYMVVIST